MSAPDLDQYAKRVIVEAFLDAWPAHLHRRAEAFVKAAPRPDDFPGCLSLEERRDQWRRCHAMAQAFRNKATFVRDFDSDGVAAEVQWLLDTEDDAA